MDARPRSVADLTLRLDDQTWDALNHLASTQCCSLEDCVLGLVRKAIRGEGKPFKRAGATAQPPRAPMDEFLPEGADPFAPAFWDAGRGSTFADVQTRMRFAGTPGLLKGE